VLPTLALTTTDSLIDRVAIAQAGLQRLLMKPATPAEVWAAATQVKQRTHQQTAQILVVDDDPLVLKALRPLLEPWGLGVTGLEQPTQFWDILQATRPDLIILDVEMPEFTGVELCQALRTDPHWQNLPVLFLTSHRDAETVQAVFQAGADDFIAKPIVGPEVLTRILNRLERTRLLQTLSHQEPLTGLPNYPHSKQTLTHWLATAQTHGQAGSLALIRVADWSAIAQPPDPDTQYAILQAWGQCFQAFGQDLGILGYWGNGEFVIGLNEATPEAAQDALTPLLQALRRQIITLPSGVRLQPATACALVSYPAEGQTLQALYQSAIAKLPR
jgi:DNA-binding response OmpR family regulator